MSITEETEEASDACCANCGVAEVDEIKLEDCDGCKSIRCCGDKCKEEHREKDEEECQKRVAELLDKKLFDQPDISHRGECPICFLPMPIEGGKCLFYSCCSNLICYGCDYANDMNNGGDRCPFCREPTADDEENTKRKMNRIKANDPAALCQMGTKRYHEGDHNKSFEYWTKAAELGDTEAHYHLGLIYREGDVVEKDKEKAVYHLEKAAIGGHPKARYNLGCHEGTNGNAGRAVKHFIIAANLGHDESMRALWRQYSLGNITKEELEATLRTHKAAIDAIKSPEREAAEKAWKDQRSRMGR